jgi:hypothetical protein
MGESLAAWLENHAGREEVHAHQVLQTAKPLPLFQPLSPRPSWRLLSRKAKRDPAGTRVLWAQWV